MNTTLSSFHRFHVVSFVLAGICFAAMALLCQSAVMGQIDTIQNSEDVSIQSDDVGVRGDTSSAGNQDSKKKPWTLKRWFWGIVMLTICLIWGKNLLKFINFLSGGKFREQNSDAYDNLMQMPDIQIQLPEPEPEPQTPPQSPTSETPVDPNSVEDMPNVPQAEVQTLTLNPNVEGTLYYAIQVNGQPEAFENPAQLLTFDCTDENRVKSSIDSLRAYLVNLGYNPVDVKLVSSPQDDEGKPVWGVGEYQIRVVFVGNVGEDITMQYNGLNRNPILLNAKLN